MKKLQIPHKLVYEKFYIHENAAVDLSKTYVLKNAKKTRKPNNRDLNRDWINDFAVCKHCSGTLLLVQKQSPRGVL